MRRLAKAALTFTLGGKHLSAAPQKPKELLPLHKSYL